MTVAAFRVIAAIATIAAASPIAATQHSHAAAVAVSQRTPQRVPVSAAQLARDPLFPILQQLDRRIAALRATLHEPATHDVSARAGADAAAVSTDASVARNDVARNASAPSSAFARYEGHTIDGIDARGIDVASTRTALLRAAVAQQATLRDAAQTNAARFDSALVAQTRAALDAYRAAMALRTDRAYTARAGLLHERELTVAYDVAQRDAARKLNLRLKLGNLHLDKQQRRLFSSRIAAMDARERAALAAQRQRDATELSAYRATLARLESGDVARETARLLASAAANRGIRDRVLSAQTAGLDATPMLPNAAVSGGPAIEVSTMRDSAASMHAGFSAAAQSTAISDGFGMAAQQLPAQFHALAASARASDAATSAQIAQLQAQRDRLYRAIVHRSYLVHARMR